MKNEGLQGSSIGDGGQQLPPRPLYDLSMVQAIGNGDPSFVKKMILLLMETMPPNLAELKQNQEKENWEAVGKLAHKMKSTIDSLGIACLKEEIRSLEANGRQQNAAPIPAQVDKVIAMMGECLAQIKKDYGI